MEHLSKFHTALAVPVALAAVVALAACSSPSESASGMNGGSSPTASAPSAAPNEADVTFVTGMIPHHTQAVAMANVILKKDGIDPSVTDLAKKIKTAQCPEIRMMNSWLTAWGKPTSTTTDIPGMDMGTGTGTMSDADTAALGAATGATASKLFLTQMTEHHRGAIDMATTEVDSGKNPDALRLAKNIVTSQTAEIRTMKDLLIALR